MVGLETAIREQAIQVILTQKHSENSVPSIARRPPLADVGLSLSKHGISAEAKCHCRSRQSKAGCREVVIVHDREEGDEQSRQSGDEAAEQQGSPESGRFVFSIVHSQN